MPRKRIADKKINKEQKKEDKIIASVYNREGKEKNKLELPKEIFGIKVNPALITQVIHVYLTNQRLGTRDTKTRSEVNGSTRKIYRQKGTGRARHGDLKAPIFIGGGIAHGPKPYDYSLKISSQAKNLALCGILSDKFRQGKIKIISDFTDMIPKTKEILATLSNLNFVNNQSKADNVLIITPEKLKNVILAGRNLENLKIVMSDCLNTYEALKAKNILFIEAAIDKLKKRLIGDRREENIKKTGKGDSSTTKKSISSKRSKEKTLKTQSVRRNEVKRKEKRRKKD